MRALALSAMLVLVGCGDDGGDEVISTDGACVCIAPDAAVPDAAADAGVCDGVAGGTACNVGFASDWPPVCCTVDQQCCEVGFEHMDCLAAAEPCPRLCGPVGDGDELLLCSADSMCGYSYPVGAPAELADGDCELFFSGTVNCEPTCPEAAACGTSCCGEGTRCLGGCCVVDR